MKRHRLSVRVVTRGAQQYNHPSEEKAQIARLYLTEIGETAKTLRRLCLHFPLICCFLGETTIKDLLQVHI